MRKGCDGGKKKTGKKEKTDENSGHYVIASCRPPERRPLERRPLVPKKTKNDDLKEKDELTASKHSVPHSGVVETKHP